MKVQHLIMALISLSNMAYSSQTNMSDTITYMSSIGAHVCDYVIQGKYGYIVHDYFLEIIDISDTGHLKKLGCLHLDDEALYIDAYKNTLFVGQRHGKFSIIDISKKSNPRWLRHVDIVGTIQRLLVANGLLFIKCTNPKLDYVYDIVDPQIPKEVLLDRKKIDEYIVKHKKNPFDWNALMPSFENVQDLSIVGDYAYLADGGGGLKILSIKDKKNPRYIKKINTKGAAIRINTEANSLYLIIDKEGIKKELYVYDISSAENPNLMCSLKFNAESIYDIASQNGTIFISSYPPKIHVIETKPRNIFLKNIIPLKSGCSSLCIYESKLLMAMDNLYFMDIVGPYIPQSIKYNGQEIAAQYISIIYHHMYIHGDGLHLYDIGPNMKLSLIFKKDLIPGGYGYSHYYLFKMYDEMAFLPWAWSDDTGGGGGLDIFTKNMDIFHYEGLGTINNLNIVNNYIFIAYEEGGMLLLKLKLPL